MAKQKTELQVKFGQKVRELRKKAKMSQEDLALESNLDRTYVSGIERGERNPSLKNIGKIAQALKVKIANFFEFILKD